MISVFLPVKTVSTLNAREHWATRARRAKKQRGIARVMVMLATRGQIRKGAALVCVLTRMGVRKLDDDNLAGALKSVRDGVADALGIDDGSELVRWEYRQEKGVGMIGVQLDIAGGGL
jgi:hypothetical protein